MTLSVLGFAAGPYKTNTYIVANGARAFVVDPGMHAMQRVLEIGAEQGLTFEAIVLTHGHLDHTREAGDLARQLELPVYIHPDDAFMLVDGSGVSAESQVLFDAKNMVQIEDLRDLRGGETIELVGHEFRLEHAPGHSRVAFSLLRKNLSSPVMFCLKARSGVLTWSTQILWPCSVRLLVRCGTLMTGWLCYQGMARRPRCAQKGPLIRSSPRCGMYSDMRE